LCKARITLVSAGTGLRGVGSAAEDLLCGRLGEEPAEILARGALSADAFHYLSGPAWRNQKATDSVVPTRWDDAHLTKQMFAQSPIMNLVYKSIKYVFVGILLDIVS